jgi:hypothetical protein
MLFLCIERIVGLKNGCRILQIIVFRSTTVIPVRSTRKVGGHLKEREDSLFSIVAKDWDILLRNALVEVLFAFVVSLLDMNFCISLK